MPEKFTVEFDAVLGNTTGYANQYYLLLYDDNGWPVSMPGAIYISGEKGQSSNTSTSISKNDGKVHHIAFANGAIVGAVSPAPADTVQRIALASRLLPPASVAVAVRIMGRADNVEKFTESSGLVGDAAVQFKQRVLVQRTARTFAAERGEYVADKRITIPVLARVEVDVCAAIYHGMRMNLSEQRLASDLRQRGSSFILFPEAAQHLARFEFDADADPILAAHRGGTSVPELEALHRDLDPRLVHAVLGALATCGVISPIESRTPAAQNISIARTPTPREPTISRVPTPRQPTTSSSVPVLLQHEAPRSSHPHLAAGSRPGVSRAATAEFDGERTTMRPAALTVTQIEQLIASRLAMLESGVDFFTFLGVPIGAPAGHVREAFLELARYLRPDRLAQHGIRDDRNEARTVYARALIAMTTLTDDGRRADYLSTFGSSPRR